MSTNWDDIPNDLDMTPTSDTHKGVLDSDNLINGQRFVKAATPGAYTSACKKCGGSGFVRIGYISARLVHCYGCNGKGTLTFKTSPEVRARAQAKAGERKEAQRLEKVAAQRAWAEDHKDVLAWIQAGETKLNEFALSLGNSLQQYGTLTVGQVAAVRRCIERAKEAKADAAKRAEIAPVVDIKAIEDAFALAMSKGVKRPTLRLDAFKFKPAAQSGKNPGAIYVTSAERDESTGEARYLGKVLGGRFVKVRACSDEEEAKIVEVASDPKTAAVAYGKRFGACSVCGRELTDGDSIERGIGPICAEKYGF